jgi:hypothetical protein
LLERGLGHVARALLDLVERLLDLVADLLRRVDRLPGFLRRLARGLDGEGGRFLDLVGDLLRLLGGVLQRLGELAQVLDGRCALLDGVTLAAELGGVAGVDEEEVIGGVDLVIAVVCIAVILKVVV